MRLFDYTLEMRSLNHQGFLFDNLSFSNFGYGGDPNDVSRLHIDKNKWYDFHLLFRRDKNFWDYNLFANPLNPARTEPGGIVDDRLHRQPAYRRASAGFRATARIPPCRSHNSAHAEDLVRRMQDYDLTLLPESRVRFRLGYSHDRDQGPGFFTTDSGTVSDFPENLQLHDERLSRRSRFSRSSANDAFPTTSSSATSSRTTPSLETPAATPGNFGFILTAPTARPSIWESSGARKLPPKLCPARLPSPARPPRRPPPTPTCNGFLSYSQVGRPRNFMPTERLRFQSNYFKNFEMSGSVGYSTCDNKIPDFDEILNGFDPRTATAREHDRRSRRTPSASR